MIEGKPRQVLGVFLHSLPPGSCGIGAWHRFRQARSERQVSDGNHAHPRVTVRVPVAGQLLEMDRAAKDLAGGLRQIGSLVLQGSRRLAADRSLVRPVGLVLGATAWGKATARGPLSAGGAGLQVWVQGAVIWGANGAQDQEALSVCASHRLAGRTAGQISSSGSYALVSDLGSTMKTAPDRI